MRSEQEAGPGHVPQGAREYRHNGFIIWTMAIFPLIFLIQPLVVVFALPTSAATELNEEHLLLYMLGIPAIVPAAVACAVVGERQQTPSNQC